MFAVNREQATTAADEAWPVVQKTLVP
jgi:hypothetical protein